MHAQLQRTNGVWEGARTGIATATESLLSQFDGSISGSVGILRETLDCYDDGAIEEEDLSAFGLVLEQFHRAVADRRAVIGAGASEPARMRAR